MGKMQKFTIVPMLMAGMIVFNGCGSKGAIKHDQHPPTEIDRYISETSELVNFSGEKVEVVFHRAGSYQEYAKNVNAKKFQYNFIAATNRGFLGFLANTIGSREINYLNTDLRERLISHEWLTGIWFDPAGINRIAETFNGINDQRKSPLDLYISTYKLKRESYLKRLRKGMATDDNGKAVKLNNVRGLIFDIQAWKE